MIPFQVDSPGFVRLSSGVIEEHLQQAGFIHRFFTVGTLDLSPQAGCTDALGPGVIRSNGSGQISSRPKTRVFTLKRVGEVSGNGPPLLSGKLLVGEILLHLGRYGCRFLLECW